MIRYFVCVLSSLFINLSLFSQVKFPESKDSLGYLKQKVHARVAMPINGDNRVWVKGSDSLNNVEIINKSTNSVIKRLKLNPPFFTSVVIINEMEIQVKFCGEGKNSCITTESLFPTYHNSNKTEDFSFLLYGCMEPFKVEYEDGKPISGVFEGDNNSTLRLRQLFRKVALKESMTYRDSIKDENKYKYIGTKDSVLLRTSPNAIIATGDQVYIDAGYGTSMRGNDVHPLSAWETKRRPYPFSNDTTKYIEYINKLYSATYSFEDIEAAHRRLPVLSTIDDHELRDGWGSQGDEYLKDGSMNPKLENFFGLGKKAFVEHQLQLAPVTESQLKVVENGVEAMDYPFQMNGVNGYIFDLRSARNIQKETVLGEPQWERFETWLESLERNQEIILVTSVPLTLRPLRFFENILKLFKPEIRDDVRDGWSSKNNLKDRNRLIALLTKHRRERDIKPIFVSGDVHKSALIEIWIDPYVGRNSKHDIKETMILGYEIVASGLSHEFIKTGISKSIFKLTESQRLGNGFIDFTYNGNPASLYPMVRSSKVSQNFGAIEFSKDKKTRLHTFVYDEDADTINQIYLDLDFDKKLPDDDYYIIEKNNRTGKVKRTFAPPIPHGLHAIFN